ncbi:DUF1413 domain-containing protein [Clostridium polynesiense]|uniref:DUF1413 domain-containing protein n=1 Tax=Clostridium polynesiense TaxID=1325933 RepID=UPI000591293A|nr:DUF1413 domain-containing protein [Clostridium polynesiense]
MSVNIQITLTDQEFKILKGRSDEAGLTPAQFIKQRALDHSEFNTLFSELCQKVEELEVGTEFDVKSIFGPKWFTIKERGIKLSLGRNFNKLVKSGNVSVKENGKDSANTQKYIKM